MALGERVKFSAGVLREEDVVVVQIDACRFRGEGVDIGGQAARVGRFSGHGWFHGVAKKASVQGARIAVEDDIGRGVACAISSIGGANSTLLHLETGDIGICHERCTPRIGKGAQRTGKLVHAALNAPDTAGFGMGDEA